MSKTGAEIVLRLLDPTPLTDDEIEEHYAWGDDPFSDTIVNFHHPFYVGMNTPVPDDATHPDEDFLKNLREATDIRLKFRRKHEHFHEKGDMLMSPRIFLFERPYRPMVLYILMRKGLYRDDPERLAEFIIDTWTDTESGRMQVWTEILEGFPMLDKTPGCEDILDPSGVTKVYRGIALGEDGEIDDPNWSWTTDKAKAEWFANRFAGLEGREFPIVIVGEVDNDKVLFCTDDRGESEVVSQAVRILEFVS